MKKLSKPIIEAENDADEQDSVHENDHKTL